jgi:hypothetical protein
MARNRTPRKNNLTTGGTDSSSSIAESSGTRDVIYNSDFTLVSYTKKNRAAAARSNQSQTTTKTVEMQTVTSWQFKNFQRTIVEIIETIATSNAVAGHPFIQ